MNWVMFGSFTRIWIVASCGLRGEESMVKLNLITIKQLQDFWNGYSAGGSSRELSNTGVRKLILACFNVSNANEWQGKARHYNGKPKYPFWNQPAEIQDRIIAMLETNPMGKEFVGEFIDSISKNMVKLIVKEGI